jgi:phosphatidate cytidylyltransferase
MLGAIAWSQWSFGLLLAALLVVGMTEFYSLAGEQGSNPQRIVGLAAGLVLFALNFAFVSDDIQILGSARQAFACGMALLLLLLPAMFICDHAIAPSITTARTAPLTVRTQRFFIFSLIVF